MRLNAYYARAFKEGNDPRIEQDTIFMWARPHPRAARSSDPVPRPNNWSLVCTAALKNLSVNVMIVQTNDLFWVVIFAPAPAIVLLWSASEHPQSHKVLPGVTKLSCPLVPGGGMSSQIIRDGVVVAECKPEGFQFNGEPQVYNYNAFVAISH